VISVADLDRLLAFLASQEGQGAAGEASPAARFDAAHVLWSAGALIVIGAMGLFSTLAFTQMGGRALTACAIAYAVAFGVAGHHLWYGRNLRVPGGLLIAIAVSMALRVATGNRRRVCSGQVVRCRQRRRRSISPSSRGATAPEAATTATAEATAAEATTAEATAAAPEATTAPGTTGIVIAPVGLGSHAHDDADETAQHRCSQGSKNGGLAPSQPLVQA
jgi:hypothetical protein